MCVQNDLNRYLMEVLITNQWKDAVDQIHEMTHVMFITSPNFSFQEMAAGDRFFSFVFYASLFVYTYEH